MLCVFFVIMRGKSERNMCDYVFKDTSRGSKFGANKTSLLTNYENIIFFNPIKSSRVQCEHRNV